MYLSVHLKVCEGCGCLWYRSQVDSGVYCAPCAQRFQEFPTPESRKRRGRPKKITLPTVLAVEDSAVPVFGDSLTNLASCSLPFPYKPGPARKPALCSACGALPPLPLAAGLRISPQAASFAASSALAASVLAGGAR
jgi:hypothetical protein